ncbi:hypothetical protein AB0C14_39560 [Microbispora hainanensis]|uniref:hypothetical protein n=1 Tax=Microbispora hainanensis TaxID=568844 RepID=UPI0033DF5D00
MKRWEKLNDRQLSLLRRICDGADPVTAKDSGLAATVYALRGRGLVVTPRRAGVWYAEITEAGKFYLDHGYHPDRPDSVFRVPLSEGLSSGPGRRSHRVAEVGSAQRLVEQLQQADGMIHISNPDVETRASYRRLIDAAKRHGLVPEGYRLRHTGRDRGEDGSGSDTGWDHVRLNIRNQLFDPAAMSDVLNRDPSRIRVSPALLPRVFIILKRLAHEAELRGYRLGMSTKRPKVTFYIVAGNRQWGLELFEEREPIQPPPPRRLLRARTGPPRRKGDPFIREPLPETTKPSGRLTLKLAPPQFGTGQGGTWMDKGRSLIESKLREVIPELDRLLDAEEQARIEHERRLRELQEEQEREEREQRVRWEAAVREAQEAAAEERRRRLFANALEAWRSAAELRRFCAALQESAAASEDAEAVENLTLWIRWGQSLADTLDPVLAPGALAEEDFDPELDGDELRPYLDGWSPYGPRIEYRFRSMGHPPSAPPAPPARGQAWRFSREGTECWRWT